MKRFINEIVNQILSEEIIAKKVVAIYPGRFQPMGSHHAKVFKWIQTKFGNSDAYIATSDKIEKPKSPLSFSEKEMIIKKHGFENLIKIRAMYNGEEYFKVLTSYDPYETSIVMVVGEKDGDRLSPKYFKKILPENDLTDLKPYLYTDDDGNENKIIYWMPAPHISLNVKGQGEMSGTSIRAALGEKSKNKKQLFKDIFGFWDSKIYNTIVPKFEELVSESIFISKEIIENWLKEKSNQNLLEISIATWPAFGKPVDDGPGLFLQDLETYNHINAERAALLGWDIINNLINNTVEDYNELRSIGYVTDFEIGVPIRRTELDREKMRDGTTYDNWLQNVANKAALVGYSVIRDKYATKEFETDNEIIKKDVLSKKETITTQQLEELKKSILEIISITIDPGEPNPMYTPDGLLRVLNRDKPEPWFKQMGYTQLDKPRATYMKGRLKKDIPPELQTRTVSYKIQNAKISTLKPALKPVGSDEWTPVNSDIETSKKQKSKLPEGVLSEIPMSDLKQIDQFADKQLAPFDVVITDRHFFDRLNDPRNNKPISSAELVGFFKRLSKNKKKFIQFLKQYGQIVAKDNRTNINIPFMNVANKVIAKTVMRKSDFKSSNPKLSFENLLMGYPDQKWIDDHNKELKRLRKKFDSERKNDYYKPVNITKKSTVGETYINNNILIEGGAAGHMMHITDDPDLTFGDMKQIIKDVLSGNIKTATEKLDGQNLMMSWKNGKAIFARNKGHIKNFGERALTSSGVKDMFAGRGDLERAFSFAADDLQSGVSKLTDKQRDRLFGEGKYWMNFEVMFPETTNVIPYGHTFLVFHGSVEYDVNGNPIGAVGENARMLAGMLKQINADVQDTYQLRGPVKLEIPKTKNYEKSRDFYFKKLDKLKSEFGLTDDDKVVEYHYKYWEDFINSKSPVEIDPQVIDGLAKRWAYGDKSFRLDAKTIPNKDVLKWAKEIDKGDLQKIQSRNMNKFEVIFLRLGAEVLTNISGFLISNPDPAIQKLRKEMKAAILKLKDSNDPKMIEFVKTQLEKFNELGGFDAIVPTEGVVFTYNGKIYKLTGAFAPINRLLGVFRYGM